MMVDRAKPVECATTLTPPCPVSRASADAEFQVPTRTLTAGGYVLRVTGEVAGSRDRVERSAPIEIVAAN